MITEYVLWLIPMLSANAVATAQEQPGPWIKCKQRLTILSANDGQIHLRTGPDDKKVKPEKKPEKEPDQDQTGWKPARTKQAGSLHHKPNTPTQT